MPTNHTLPTKLPLILRAYRTLLADNGALFLLVWATIIFVLQWFFAYEQLIAVWRTGPEFISQFLIDGYVAFFKNIWDVIPITITLIALFQALSIVALIEMKNKPTRSEKTSYSIALIGSGCVACGTSILSPFLSGLSTSAAAATGDLISSLFLYTALGLAIISWWQSGRNLLTNL